MINFTKVVCCVQVCVDVGWKEFGEKNMGKKRQTPPTGPTLHWFFRSRPPFPAYWQNFRMWVTRFSAAREKNIQFSVYLLLLIDHHYGAYSTVGIQYVATVGFMIVLLSVTHEGTPLGSSNSFSLSLSISLSHTHTHTRAHAPIASRTLIVIRRTIGRRKVCALSIFSRYLTYTHTHTCARVGIK